MAGRRVVTAADLKHRAQVQFREPAQHSMVTLPEETAQEFTSHVGGV